MFPARSSVHDADETPEPPTLKVLIVDDDCTNRLILRAILLKDGYEVVEAGDGEEAQTVFEQQRPDMVLMDIMMPVMDGYEATRRIKAMAADRFVPVIFLTAVLDDNALAKCVACGGDDFLNKPYNRIILKAKIDALERVRRLYFELKKQKDQLAYHHERLQHEHEVAERVFSKIVQTEYLDTDSIRYLLAPMAIANGDFVLAAKRPMGGRHVMLGDFTGHGLSAALGAIPVSDIFYSMTAKGFSILDVIAEINKKLRDKLPTGFFLAACLLEFEPGERKVKIWNGGLPDVLVYGGDKTIKARIPSSHLPLGVVPNAQVEKRVEEIDIGSDDKVFIYSDGVIEARNPNGELFSEARFEAYFHKGLESQAVFNEICDGVAEFRGAAAQSDDITLIEVSPSSRVAPAHQSANEEEIDPDAAQWTVNIELGPAALRSVDTMELFSQMLEQIHGLNEHRGRLYTVLAELFSNALEHGLLRLDSGDKQTAEGFSQYYERRATALAALREGHIRMDVSHIPCESGGIVSIAVEDSGPGFAFGGKDDADRQAVSTKSGRGINLVKSLCSEVVYRGRGNRVEAKYHWQ